VQQSSASQPNVSASADRGVWRILFASAAALYLLTMAPGVVWQDGGEYQVRALLGEWTHPAGLARAHVLYILLVGLLGRLPFGGPALFANLVSALCGAVTVANVGWLSARWLGSRWAALIAAWTLMCSHTLWQFSTSAEVYTLAAALMSCELCALLRFREDRRLRWLLIVALANGLGLATHNFALLSAAVYVALAVRFCQRWPRGVWKWALAMAGCWLLGALPLLVLAFNAWIDSRDAMGVIRSLLTAGYGQQMLRFDWLVTVGSLLLSFPTPLFVLVPIGFWAARRRSADWFWWLLLAAWAVHFGFAAQYGMVDRYSFFIPSYVPMTIFLAAGVGWLLRPRPSVARRGILTALAFLPVGVYAVLPAAARHVEACRPGILPIPSREVPCRDRYHWFFQPWRTGDTGPARYARRVLRDLPTDAFLLADSLTSWPLVYLQQTEGLRPDVRIKFGRFLEGRPAENPTPQEYDRWAEAGRLFITSDRPGYVLGFFLRRYQFEPAGWVFALRPVPASRPAGD
jgi:hypothetical protein